MDSPSASDDRRGTALHTVFPRVETLSVHPPSFQPSATAAMEPHSSRGGPLQSPLNVSDLQRDMEQLNPLLRGQRRQAASGGPPQAWPSLRRPDSSDVLGEASVLSQNTFLPTLGAHGEVNVHLVSLAASATVGFSSGCSSSKALNMEDEEYPSVYQLPNNQRTFFFAEDNIEFSSEFDSGNLIQVERTGPFRYNMYTSQDCGNSPVQTNNRQWFHFSIRGGSKGATLTITMIGMMHSKMFTFNWMPVMAVAPNRPQYTRLLGRASVVSLDHMPPTPGYPQLIYKEWPKKEAVADRSGADGTGKTAAYESTNDDDADTVISPADSSKEPLTAGGGSMKKKKKKAVAMNLTFEFRLDVETPLLSAHRVGDPDCPAIYIASNHPYSYTTLQRNIALWQQQTELSKGCNSHVTERSREPLPGCPSQLPQSSGLCAGPSGLYFHREILCKTLDGNNVDLLTITDVSAATSEVMPLLSEDLGIPYSSARGDTQRPTYFKDKEYVILSARVHPGECPSSHIMHGCIEYLLNSKDPRAVSLRQRFVFFSIPMINPDGVIRGHSRADTCGVNLNRMYRKPSFRRHPAPFCIRLLINTLAATNRLALFIDMHAHANKKGTFFYGNAMGAEQQVQNMLYAKLVSLNTPYFEFTGCNFSQSNMFAVGKSGEGKDTSSRVTTFQDTGLVHSYTIEASHVAGNSANHLVSLSGIPGEECDGSLPAGMRYSPETFADTGKGLLVALLDLKGANPVSRLPISPFQSVKGLALWIRRQMQTEIAEVLFVQAFQSGGQALLLQDMHAKSTKPAVASVFSALGPEDVADTYTLKSTKSLPPFTVHGVRGLLPLELAATLLMQTPPSGPPRSLICGAGRTQSPSSLPNTPNRASVPLLTGVCTSTVAHPPVCAGARQVSRNTSRRRPESGGTNHDKDRKE